MIHPYRGIVPKIDPSAFLAESAEIIGDVEIGRNSSVWFNSVIRGDVNYIRIGEQTNVQDGCLLHVRHNIYPLIIGSNVTLGHGVIAHACRIEDFCLLGMGAIVLDNAQINSYTLVAAGAVVREQATFPEGVLLAGVPAKVVRDLKADERAMIEQSALNYTEYVRSYRNSSG